MTDNKLMVKVIFSKKKSKLIGKIWNRKGGYLKSPQGYLKVRRREKEGGFP